MNSHPLLMELREKLSLAKDVLKAEKSNLRMTDELLLKEKDDTAKELGAEKLKINENDGKIKCEKETLKEKKTNYEESLKVLHALSEQQQDLKKDIKKLILSRERERDKLVFQLEKLEKQYVELNKRQELLKEANNWTRISLENDLKAAKAENDLKFEEETKALAKDSAKKTEEFFEALNEISDNVLKVKQREIMELQDSLYKLTLECEYLQNKNKDFEEEIKLLKEQCLIL